MTSYTEETVTAIASALIVTLIFSIVFERWMVKHEFWEGWEWLEIFTWALALLLAQTFIAQSLFPFQFIVAAIWLPKILMAGVRIAFKIGRYSESAILEEADAIKKQGELNGPPRN